MYIKADENGIKTVDGAKSWRLVHDGVRVIFFGEAEGTAIAGGITEIFVSESKADCEAEIAKLELLVEPVEETAKVE